MFNFKSIETACSILFKKSLFKKEKNELSASKENTDYPLFTYQRNSAENSKKRIRLVQFAIEE